MENIKRVNLPIELNRPMRKICLILVSFIALSAIAQDKLVIMGKPNDMYVEYKAMGSENLQGVANGFGLSVTKLLSYNKININAGAVLPKGTRVKIPLTRNNLLQQPGDNSAPVYHVIKKGENLYRVSQAYNKVPLASIREWNHLKKDVVKSGQEVIIGYMVNAKPAPAEKKTDPKKEAPVVNAAAQTTPSVPEKKSTEKTDLTASSAIVKDQPVNVPASTVTKSISATDDKKTIVTNTRKNEVDAEYVPREGDEGFFATGYADHAKEQVQQFRSGDASIFKTISGWTDRKFYVLMNDVSPKTIVRITGPGNKSICAMVLGPLQETKGAGGLLLRLSNSAASALGLTDPKFTVTVTYFE